jgi:hypothetical protein
MASLKQIEANRRNAQLSTGPVSAAGKAVSRMNALKTGIDARSQIIHGEDPAALEQLTRHYYERFQPQGPEECDLIDAAISSAWLLRRLRKTEAEIWNSSIDWDSEHHPDQNYLQSRAYAGADRALDRCHTRIAALERSLRAALETLARLRKQAFTIQPEAEPVLPSPQPLVPSPQLAVRDAETNPIPAPTAASPRPVNGSDLPVSQPPLDPQPSVRHGAGIA